MPVAGTPGIECRSGGASGDYTLIFKFVNPITNVDAVKVTSGTGQVSTGAIDNTDAHNYIVTLTGVANAQTINVALSNVSDSANNFSFTVSAPMSILLGDVNALAGVTGGDVNDCKAQVGVDLSVANFRDDVNLTGFVSGSDVNAIKAQVGAALP
jgi:hypothetical protein